MTDAGCLAEARWKVYDEALRVANAPAGGPRGGLLPAQRALNGTSLTMARLYDGYDEKQGHYSKERNWRRHLNNEAPATPKDPR